MNVHEVGKFLLFAAGGTLAAVGLVGVLLLLAECEQKLADFKPRALATLAVCGLVLLGGFLMTLRRL